MSDIRNRLADLSPARRKLLELRLRLAKQQAAEAGIPRLPREGEPFPLSFAQQRLWLLDRIQPGSAAYNMPSPVYLEGPLDVPSLERALNDVVRRHETLRTSLAMKDGEPVQVVRPHEPFALSVEQVRVEGDGERVDAELQRLADAEAARPFDLERDPLFRVRLLRVRDELHLLLMTIHHVVSDGWSSGVLMGELKELYSAYSEGREAAFPELEVQYADFASWQRGWLTGDELDRQTGYWGRQLAGAPALLDLPTDRPRTGGDAPGANLTFRLTEEARTGLLKLAHQEDATLFMVLLAVYGLVLGRNAGQEDVVVGTPIANRRREELERVVGFFANTLALRVRFEGDPSFRDLLRQVRDATLGAFDHQDLPFEKLVEELRVERSLAHAPVFQVMFVLQNAPPAAAAGAMETGALKFSGIARADSTAKFDLSLVMNEIPDGMFGMVEYNAALFDRERVDSLVRQFAHVLEQVLERADAPVSTLDLLEPDEAARILAEWSGPDAPPHPQAVLHRLFEARADADPAAPAVVHEGRSLTYGEVESLANRVANRLRALGAGPEVRVALAVERSPEMVAALLAVLKSGGAYVPVDPAYPAERIALLLQDSGAPLLLTTRAVAATLPAHGARVVLLDDEETAAADDCRPRSGVGGGNTAYVIYTSGSTGRPKGVVVTHASLADHVVDAAERYGLTAEDRVLQFLSVSFDGSAEEIFSALAAGAVLVLRTEAMLASPADLMRECAAAGVTVASLATAYWHEVAAEAERLTLPQGLRLVWIGGERCRPERLVQWRRAFGDGVAFVNAYGPTEATIVATAWRLPADAEPEYREVPIGAPVHGARAYVLDPALKPVPAGVAAELHLGGRALARGYLDRPGITAERFVPSPFGDGDRLYRTGDRVRWRRDGTLEFVGRMDDQVKVRGFRIELGEVEAALRAVDGVADAAAVALDDASGQKRLVAYVVPGGGAEVTADAVRAALRERLPDYMVPAAVVVLDAMPLTAGGKTDRRALPAPDLAAAREAYVPPRTPEEEALAEVWAELLGVTRVGAHDSFFDLGGHSLLATRVVSRVREMFGVELPLRAVFEAPSLAQLAARVVEAQAAGEGSAAAPPLVPAPRDRPIPLSFAQERLWFIDRMDPGNATYNLGSPLRLGGAVDADALERALGEVLRRHEALRTRLVTTDAGPVQVVDPFAGFTLPRVDLSALDADARDAELGRLVAADGSTGFDLEKGPLFRASLVRLAPDDHVLLMTMHHVVSDGWSMGILLREVNAAYEAFRRGETPRLPHLPVQYPDFAAWQRGWLAGDELARQIAFWRAALDGAPAVLELPGDRPRPPVQSHRGAQHPFAMPAELGEALRELARGADATLFMTLLAAWQLLLGKLAGQDDVVVGTPIAGRRRREVEGLIGFFVNTLALRGDLSGDPTFGELLGRVREATLGAYAHQDLPFEKLVEELHPERSLAHSPVFQAMFSMQHAPDAGGAASAEGGEGGGLSMGGVAREGTVAKYDLTLNVTEMADGVLAGSLEYASDLFDAATAARLLERFGALLVQVASDPTIRLSQVTLVTDEERATLVEEWSGASVPAHPEEVIHDYFEGCADEHPHRVALFHDGVSLTFAELDARANRLAHHLRRVGVEREAVVGLCMGRSPDLIVAVLAVLKAGAAYLPIDPAYPGERIAYLLGDAGVPVLVTTEAIAPTLPAHGARVVRMDADAEAIAAESAERPSAGVVPANLAYVIYTSGSTGKPKGVMVTHRGLSNHARLFAKRFRLGPGDRLLQFHSVSFDASAEEIFPPLVTGSTVVLRTEATADSPAAFARDAAAWGITIAALPTAFWHEVAAEADRVEIPASLRLMVVGGERLSPTAAAAWHRAVGGRVPLVNAYGPTETTISVTAHEVPAPAEGSAREVPIGRPMLGSRGYVVDRAGQLVPPGVPGELWVGGAGVSRGYLGRPGLTAERFVPSPFGDGDRLYRTGDTVRWLPGGVLEYLGRADDQVKVRGFRIELGEVEAAICAFPAVREAIVVARDDAGGMKRLVAYVVGRGGAAPVGDEVRGWLRERLPEHMVPSAVVALEAFPLSPAGKVDRRALPAPDFASSAEHVAPRTATEEALAEIWSELLNVPRVGAHDGFFELGGHSLLATRVVSRVRERFGVELPLRALFEAPRLAELARRVDDLAAGVAEASLPPLVPAERDGPLPLSFAQERLWFIDRLRPGTAVYNMPFANRLAGPLDVAALEKAIGALVRRHEPLRTVLVEGAEGMPVQVVRPYEPFVLRVDDASGLDDDAREAEVARRANLESTTPFDLATGPLFRASLLRTGPEEHVLFMAMHHVVSDGWSMGVVFAELDAAYAAFARGEEPAFAPLPVQYADFAVWQRGWLRGEELERQIGWWRRSLGGAPALLELPIDRPRPPVQSQRGARHGFALPGELAGAVRELARATESTLFMTVLAALQVTLGKLAGQDDVVVGTPIAGRRWREVEGLVGFFVNTLALRGDLSGDPTFRQLVAGVRENTLGAYAHQDLPFEKLVEELHPERSLAHSPLFQVLFALQNTPDGGDGTEGALKMEPVGRDIATTAFDLTLNLYEHGDGSFVGSLEYATDIFDADTATAILERFGRVLSQVVADPDRPLSRVTLLADEEMGALVERGGSATEYPRDRHVVSLFDETAGAAPDALAVRFGGEALTYAELRARANRLAHRLRALGVGPEARVGISMERSAGLVVAMLAALKAGGAYVPLDPAYPAERLAFMLEDAGVSALVVEDEVPEALSAFAGPVVSLRRDAAALAGEPDADPDAALFPESLAYVVYTSGSTGRPKGIAVPHRGIVRLVRDSDYARLTAEDRVAQVSNASFDAATFEVWGALLNGAALVGVSRDDTLSPRALVEAFRREGVTASFLTTALFDQVAREVPGGFAGVRHLLFGGEAADPGSARRVLAAGGPERLINVYGPTESTTFATWHPVGALSADAATVPIGGPVANTTAYVLDEAMRPVPQGVVGELYLGGDGLARGYPGRAGLTAERFVPSPWGDGERLYRTGDGVRWNRGGAMEFVRRLDEQVKVRGFRIEPGEVRAVLLAHPSVRDAAVLARQDAPGDRRLVAYVVPAEGEVDVAALRADLRAGLPEYMVPSAFVSVESIPLTANGKVDRRALPAPEVGSAVEYVAPRTQTEATLAALWSELLNAARVGAQDSFFDLGGHSLLATRVVSRVRETLGVEVPLRALFERPTLEGFAARVDDAVRADAGGGAPPLVRAEHDGDVPLSFAQERLWILDQMEPGSTLFNMPSPLKLTGTLDAAALERAVDALVERHESLRTVFRQGPDGPVQHVTPHEPFRLEVVDLSHLGEEERTAEVMRIVAQDAGRPFDLATGPLFRARLLKASDREHVLAMGVHHVVSDGWSSGIVRAEISALYEAFAAGRPSPLPPLPVRYSDYAVWQRGWLQGEALERQLDYWKGRFTPLPEPIELPMDRPRPAVQTHHGGLVGGALPKEAVAALQDLSRREGATLFMTLLAAFQALLARWSGQTDVVVGTPIAGRNRAETEGLVGLFLNTLALRSDLSADPTFREIVAQVRETTLGAYAHQDVPFEKLLEEIQPERSLSHTPLFQVMFNMLNLGGEAAPERGGLRVENFGGGGGEPEAKFDLNLYAQETPDGLGLGLVYNTDLFDRARMEEMMAHLGTLLAAVLENPDLRLSQVPLRTPEQARAHASGANRVAVALPFREWTEDADATLHGRFESVAAANAERVAVRTTAHEWTYAELDARADAAARVAASVEGERVALLFEHDAPMLAGILGALKAGRTYVPLDPAYPRERVAYILSDSGAAAILTNERNRALAEELAEGAVRVLVLDAEGAASSGAADGGTLAGSRTVSPDQPAYVLYTSGSTGRPKGVVQSHRNVLHHIRAYTHALHISSADRLTLFSSYTFDAAVMGIWGALLNGATLCPFSWKDEAAAELPEWVREQGITLYHSTPTVFRHLIGSLEPGEVLDGVTRVVLGGEEAQRRDVELWRSHFRPDCVLVNGLGPTESTLALQQMIDRETEIERNSVPVGFPVEGTSVRLMTPAGEQVATFGVGEIEVESEAVALGYWNRPEETAAAFGAEDGGTRRYRTGDLGRWLPDGAVEYLGRKDFQVKIRGHRVEVGEIEVALRSHAAVKDAVVVAWDDPRGDKFLFAYVVPVEGAGPEALADLRDHVKAGVPDYMVPAAFAGIPELPLTPNGKVDRRALPEPKLGGGGDRPYEPPRDETEQAVVDIWRQVLGVERVGIRDDFFALGGHSLLATQVVSRVKQAFDVKLPLRTFFENPTVAGLAQAIEAEQAATMERLLDEMGDLTDEEVQALLEAEAAEAGEDPAEDDSAGG